MEFAEHMTDMGPKKAELTLKIDDSNSSLVETHLIDWLVGVLLFWICIPVLAKFAFREFKFNQVGNLVL